MRILLAEEEPVLGNALSDRLRQSGFRVDWVRDGREAEHAIATGAYVAAVLDLELPLKDGLRVLKALRKQGNETPILALSERDSEQDQILGLQAGADRYLIKPVDVQDLTLRLWALVRQTHRLYKDLLECGTVSLNPFTRCVTQRGELVALTAREFDVLQVLMRNAGRVMSREQLELAVYSLDEGTQSNAIEVYIHYLRRKLGPDLIRTVQRIGYVLTPPIEPGPATSRRARSNVRKAKQ